MTRRQPLLDRIIVDFEAQAIGCEQCGSAEAVAASQTAAALFARVVAFADEHAKCESDPPKPDVTDP